MLTGCAASNYNTAETDHDEPITAEFHVIGNTAASPKVIGFIKPYDSAGKLGVCQAYLIDGNDDEYKALKQHTVDQNSYVELTSTESEHVRFAIIGAALYRVTLDPSKRITVSRMKAHSGTTSLPWSDELRHREIRLALFKTVYRRSTTSIPIYVPRFR